MFSLFYSAVLCLSAFATSSLFFFFNDTATTEIYTLSLHDALPICLRYFFAFSAGTLLAIASGRRSVSAIRSEEHTSELQSHHDLVCRLLLEKKKNKQQKQIGRTHV